MANPEHVKAVLAGGEALDRLTAKGVRLDLSDANLNGSELSGAHLSGAHLQNVDLSGAKLNGERIQGADLTGADLRNTNLPDARIADAQLIGADLRNANLHGADLSSINLRGANLRNTNLRNANLCNSNLRDANLHGAKLRNAKLNGTNFRGGSLYGANLNGARLLRADLNGANLNGADLNGADLSGADLNGAKLHSTNLRHAELRNADLRSAEFIGANLLGANLSHAKLQYARIQWTSLNGANLTGTDLTNARFGRTSLGGLDLSEALGVLEVKHFYPSSLGLDSLAKSKGKIPRQFLEGCGLKDWEIENAKLYRRGLSEGETTDIVYRVHNLLHGPAVRLHPVFLSHATEDKPFVRKLEQALQQRGVRCWLDEKELVPGHELWDELDRGINLYDKTVLVCSEASLKSKWVERELRKVLQKEERIAKLDPKASRLLVPIRLDEHVFEWDSGMRSEVVDRVVGDFSKHRNKKAFDAAVDLLVRALRTDGGRSTPPPSYLPSREQGE